ncbi:MAG TPA: SRPBCC family protein [Ilumatobacteraceae bacterium]|nr:SRPBCC family protein [Ilumatobacteraceae bacterium]
MRIERSATLVAAADAAFAMVDDLGRYPEWMDLVHEVTDVPSGERPTWEVELQARVGPFARSKRLRMERTVHDPNRRVVFERREVDGRSHSPWVLDSTLEPLGDSRVLLTMVLTYGGNLWAGAVLERVLDDHVERGTEALAALLAPTVRDA